MYPMDDINLNFIHNTKFSFTANVDLDCTPEQLFEVFQDPVSWTVWAGAIQKVEWTSPQPFGIGTTRTVSMAGGMEGYEEFIAWDPGKHMAFKFTQSNKNSVTAFGEDYIVTDLGNGRCHLQWTMAMAPRGASTAIMTLFKSVMGWYVQKQANNLGKYITKNVPQTATEMG
jgi:hypothetical protein